MHKKWGGGAEMYHIFFVETKSCQDTLKHLVNKLIATSY